MHIIDIIDIIKEVSILVPSELTYFFSIMFIIIIVDD